jgi:hypothetical protein
MPQERYLTPEELAAEKKAVADRCQPFEVVGNAGIRDSITRETVYAGGTVMLDPQTILIGHLVQSGAVKPVKAAAKVEKK